MPISEANGSLRGHLPHEVEAGAEHRGVEALGSVRNAWSTAGQRLRIGRDDVAGAAAERRHAGHRQLEEHAVAAVAARPADGVDVQVEGLVREVRAHLRDHLLLGAEARLRRAAICSTSSSVPEKKKFTAEWSWRFLPTPRRSCTTLMPSGSRMADRRCPSAPAGRASRTRRRRTTVRPASTVDAPAVDDHLGAGDPRRRAPSAGRPCASPTIVRFGLPRTGSR